MNSSGLVEYSYHEERSWLVHDFRRGFSEFNVSNEFVNITRQPCSFSAARWNSFTFDYHFRPRSNCGLIINMTMVHLIRLHNPNKNLSDLFKHNATLGPETLNPRSSNRKAVLNDCKGMWKCNLQESRVMHASSINIAHRRPLKYTFKNAVAHARLYTYANISATNPLLIRPKRQFWHRWSWIVTAALLLWPLFQHASILCGNWRDHRAWNTVRHCFEKGSASAWQSRPICSHPWKRITKSPSLYAPDSSVTDALPYEFIFRCGTSASLESMVGCHWTICSYSLSASATSSELH